MWTERLLLVRIILSIEYCLDVWYLLEWVLGSSDVRVDLVDDKGSFRAAKVYPERSEGYNFLITQGLMLE